MNTDYEMREYKHLHYIHSNINKSKTNPKKKKLAVILHKNLKKMHLEEKKLFIFKCLDEKNINLILLKFELDNFCPETVKNMEFTNFIKIAKKYINRYQYDAGGFLIEDKIWNLYTSESEEYNLEEKEIIFENSLFETNLNDSETIEFIEKLTNLLNKISDNIEVTKELVQSKKESLVWILLRCKKI
jgi:hypothetical protein